MKPIILLGLLLLMFLGIQCLAQDKKKEDYEFPKEMLDDVKIEYEKLCEKGKILYEINCAGCHNIKQKRKSVVPDFSVDQLKGYEIRIANKEHEANMPDEKVTAEELVMISAYLAYKKKTGVPVSIK